MRVAVLGAGLQGACVAMELTSRGVAVELYDKADTAMAGASSHNEGKIHLGYVYANDPTLRTARTMIEGGLSFAPLLRRWLGDRLDDVPVSDPFYYLVHRGSLLGVAEVEDHFAACQRIALERLHGEDPDYLGSDPRIPPQRLTTDECTDLADPRTVKATYRTPELAVDPRGLAKAVRARLDEDPAISLRTGTEVLGVTPDQDGVTVHAVPTGSDSAEDHDQRFDQSYDHVVNALWESRLAIDATAGVRPERPWLHRVKHYLRLPPDSQARVPSATILLGPFGDSVRYDDGGAFLSWYPAGRRGTSTDLRPPAWPLVLEQAAAAEVRHATLAGLADVVPAVGILAPDVAATSEVQGGIIVAHGHTDIDDPQSVLHERHAIGPRSYGRYHTVDTGKLTMAPLFGWRTARLVLATDPVPREPQRA